MFVDFPPVVRPDVDGAKDVSDGEVKKARDMRQNPALSPFSDSWRSKERHTHITRIHSGVPWNGAGTAAT